MTSTRDDHSLSRLELVVLARLSAPKPPSEKVLGAAVLELALPDTSAARARAVAVDTLAALRARGLVSEQGRTLTDEGKRVLRGALGLSRVPTWTEARTAHFPARALGLAPGSDQAAKAVRTKDALCAAVLRGELGVREAPTLQDLCDALIAEALGLPAGPLNLSDLRTYVFARRAGVEPAGKPKELAARFAAKSVGAKDAGRSSLVQALVRRWVQEGAAPAERPAQPASPEALLDVVREAIPRVGTDGRYGAEKVFVSAIWHSIERDRRLDDLSLDRFKRWLVGANRDGWLVLARADLVGAMDAKLVAESEIQDQGATFHFVLDQRAGAHATERGNHAR
ncbi:MAG TPA: hypothetical protein VNO30_17195 [Kofleriaceae bacterium]|nr:hypothetical protein [Kofleriaceae bacterium]